MQEALELGSRVKRVGGGYRDEPYDVEELLQLGAEEVLRLRELLWVSRRELDEERGQHSLAHQAVLSAARLEAEELRSQLAEMEVQLDRSAFSVRVLGEKSEKAMELLAIKAEKEAEMEAALQRAEAEAAEAAASVGGAALAQVKAEHAARQSADREYAWEAAHEAMRYSFSPVPAPWDVRLRASSRWIVSAHVLWGMQRGFMPPDDPRHGAPNGRRRSAGGGRFTRHGRRLRGAWRRSIGANNCSHRSAVCVERSEPAAFPSACR